MDDVTVAESDGPASLRRARACLRGGAELLEGVDVAESRVLQAVGVQAPRQAWGPERDLDRPGGYPSDVDEQLGTHPRR